MVGTLQFLAPEVLMRKVASGASDVYSFAITSCEFASCQVPFADRSRNVALAHTILDYTYNDTDLTAAIVKEGLRPKFPPSSPQGSSLFLSAVCFCQHESCACSSAIASFCRLHRVIGAMLAARSD